MIPAIHENKKKKKNELFALTHVQLAKYIGKYKQLMENMKIQKQKINIQINMSHNIVEHRELF